MGFATTVIPRAYTYYISTALFFIFGFRMLYEGYNMKPGEGQEELEEVQADLRKKDEEVNYNERKDNLKNLHYPVSHSVTLDIGSRCPKN